jgi:hypothetical protein
MRKIGIYIEQQTDKQTNGVFETERQIETVTRRERQLEVGVGDQHSQRLKMTVVKRNREK